MDLLREMIKNGHKPLIRNVTTLYRIAFELERMDLVEEMRLICAPIHVKGSPQTIFQNRSNHIESLLDDVYGPERGRNKERTKHGMCPQDYKKLVNVNLYQELLQQQ